jgi:aconitate hydratase
MPNSFNALATLHAAGQTVSYYRLDALADHGIDVSQLPFSLKVLLENLLRHEDGVTVTAEDIKALARWNPRSEPDREIAFRPSRVLLQDFTGVPAIVDLAAMRDAMKRLGGNPRKINPLQPVELVIDHSVQVDEAGTTQAFATNAELEFQRNKERYAFLRWGQDAFSNFRVVPPDTGIVHQVNLEYLARVVFGSEATQGATSLAYPDTLVGTDSHTTMINGLGVLGWGVGGIEAEAAMLGQPVSMLVPQVVGFKLTGSLPEGATATDLVLTVTQMLRKRGVVGKFVEYYGTGLAGLPLADRATIANMAPEYGATCGLFPIDAETIRYLELSGRPPAAIKLVEAYAKAQGMYHSAQSPEAEYSDTLELDLSTVEPSLAGPRRPQDRVPLHNSKTAFQTALKELQSARPKKSTSSASLPVIERFASEGGGTAIGVAEPEIEEGTVTPAPITDGSVVIAAITSCTNTSNPSVMVAAGLLAKKAVEKGLKTKPWVKASLAPGSKVVTDYLHDAGLDKYLDQLRFNLVGYGCTTCIGNSGPLAAPIEDAIVKNNVIAAAVLSGNRNFEARVHQSIKANFLMSPPLVVAFALAGRVDIDLSNDPLGAGKDGKPVYLRDIWPSLKEVRDLMQTALQPDVFRKLYKDFAAQNPKWNEIPSSTGNVYEWDKKSTYIQEPPFFEKFSMQPGEIAEIKSARALAVFGDSVTTDHISPAGSIKKSSPAGKFLIENGVEPGDFNSYGSRRGNDRVMTRGTFANVRIKNLMLTGVEGGDTLLQPEGSRMSIYDAALAYQKRGTPLVVIAGQEYGTGSSRDWAAKGTNLLGVKAVVAQSFERIHRSNLVGMGVLPLQFKEGVNAQSLKLDGSETYDIVGLGANIKPQQDLTLRITRKDGKVENVPVKCRIDTPIEIDYYQHGGILPFVLRQLVAKA